LQAVSETGKPPKKPKAGKKKRGGLYPEEIGYRGEREKLEIKSSRDASRDSRNKKKTER